MDPTNYTDFNTDPAERHEMFGPSLAEKHADRDYYVYVEKHPDNCQYCYEDESQQRYDASLY